MEPNSEMIQRSAKECFLHRSLWISVGAFVLSAYSFINAVLNLANPALLHVRRTPFFIVGPLTGIWLLATLAQRCKQLRERLFYCVGTVYFALLGARTVLPLSSASIRACEFLDLALGATAIVISGAIVLWHLRVRASSSGWRN